MTHYTKKVTIAEHKSFANYFISTELAFRNG